MESVLKSYLKKISGTKVIKFLVDICLSFCFFGTRLDIKSPVGYKLFRRDLKSYLIKKISGTKPHHLRLCPGTKLVSVLVFQNSGTRLDSKSPVGYKLFRRDVKFYLIEKISGTKVIKSSGN